MKLLRKLFRRTELPTPTSKRDDAKTDPDIDLNKTPVPEFENLCPICNLVPIRIEKSLDFPAPRNESEAWALGCCVTPEKEDWVWCQNRGIFEGRICWDRRKSDAPYVSEERRTLKPLQLRPRS